jgi:dTDP-4-dehydrorhamnose reductase
MKIILFGSNGMLGNYFYRYLSQFHDVKAITRNDFDVLNNNLSDLDNLFDKYDIAINCIGLIPQRQIENGYFRINSEFPHLLNAIAQKHNCRLIHITTDCVFSGSKGNYIETDKHDEMGVYGYSKSLGEPLTAMVIRTSIIGEEARNKKSLLEWVRNQEGKVNGYINHYWNGVTCLELAKIVNDLISQNIYWNGVRHVFSPKSVSKFELIRIISDVYDLKLDIVPHETQIVDKTLNTIYSILCSKDLEQQIQELFNFH